MFSRRAALSAAALSLALTLSACGEESTTTPPSEALSGIKVEGTDTAKAPKVTLDSKPLKATKTELKVLTEGKGDKVTAASVVTINAVFINASDGKEVVNTWSNGGKPVGLNLADSQALFPALRTAIVDHTAGSRILVLSPPKDAFGDQGNSNIGVAGTDSVAMVVDIVGATVPLKVATGTTVAPKAGLPTAVFHEDKAATLTFAKGAKAPTSLVVQPLITGSGAVVKAGQNVLVSYTGVIWGTGKKFDSSFDHGTGKTFDFVAGGGNVIKGWDKGVTGQKVGSRLLLVVPPAEGYGAAGSGEIKGTDTIVFVVDVLAAY